MKMRVIGAGMGRTGTMSLKLALQRLLGAPCYHMLELIQHPEHLPVWQGAVRGQMPDWHAFFSGHGYVATVDWPGAAYWLELSEAFPDAIVLLSVRDSQSWWRSADQTIFPGLRGEYAHDEWLSMIHEMMATRFTARIDDAAASIAAFEHNNAEVRRRVAPERLVEWRLGDGWAPLCAALGVPVPDEPFPHVNTTEEFNTRKAAVLEGKGLIKH